MATPRSRVSRVLVTGPVAPFADAYRAELLARGYTPLSAVNELRQVKRFSRWLDAGGLAVAELSEARVEEFLAYQRASGVDCRHSLSRPGLMCLLDVLRALGVLAAETPAVADSSRICCWPVFSGTCSPSGGWPLARSSSTWRARVGSWMGCRRIVGLLGSQRVM